MKKIIILTIFILNLTLIQAQSYFVEWEKLYYNSGNEEKDIKYISHTLDSGFVIINKKEWGRVVGYGFDLILTKYNKNGEYVFKKKYVSDNHVMFVNIIQTKDEGFLLITNKKNNIIKLDSNFKLIWENKYEATLHDNILQAQNGTVYITSYKILLTIKDNNIVTYNTKYTYLSIIPTSDNKFVGIDNEGGLSKINEKGEIIWRKTFQDIIIYSNNRYRQNTLLIQTKDNGFAIINIKKEDKSLGEDIYSVKFIETDNNGNLLQENTYKINSYNLICSFVQINNGKFLIAMNNNQWNFGIIDEKGNLVYEYLSKFNSVNLLYVNKERTISEYSFSVFDNYYNFILKTNDGGFLLIGQEYKFYKEGLKFDEYKTKIIKIQNIDTLISLYINQKIKEWEKKGKYEKQSDYQARITSQKKQLQLEELKKGALIKYGTIYFLKCKPNLRTKNSDYLKYDTENEIFKIMYKNITPIYLPVSINQAQSFDDNFIKMQYSDFDFDLTTDTAKWVIKKVTIKDTINNKTYHYNSSKTYNFNE